MNLPSIYKLHKPLQISLPNRYLHRPNTYLILFNARNSPLGNNIRIMHPDKLIR